MKRYRPKRIPDPDTIWSFAPPDSATTAEVSIEELFGGGGDQSDSPEAPAEDAPQSPQEPSGRE